MSNIAKFHVNFHINIFVLCVSLSSIFTIAKPKISSINDSSILTNFCSFGFKIIFSFRNRGVNLFKKAKTTSS